MCPRGVFKSGCLNIAVEALLAHRVLVDIFGDRNGLEVAENLDGLAWGARGQLKVFS
jgi:hypothetical protein